MSLRLCGLLLSLLNEFPHGLMTVHLCIVTGPSSFGCY